MGFIGPWVLLDGENKMRGRGELGEVFSQWVGLTDRRGRRERFEWLGEKEMEMGRGKKKIAHMGCVLSCPIKNS